MMVLIIGIFIILFTIILKTIILPVIIYNKNIINYIDIAYNILYIISFIFSSYYN